MEFALEHGFLAGMGAAAAICPILIHLLMRQRPKAISFPALGLIRKQQQLIVRRMQLQQWLLLLLRILLLALLGLALARPRLQSSLFAMNQKTPLSAVFIIDTSPSMKLTVKGKSRLEESQESVEKLVAILPENSEVAVLDTSVPQRGVFLEPLAALTQARRLVPRAVTNPLNRSLEAAYRTLSAAKFDRRAIYLFTDRAAHAWNLADSSRLEALRQELPAEVPVYLIDASAEAPKNISLSEPRLPQQILSANSELQLGVQVSNSGDTFEGQLALYLDDQDQPVDLQSLKLPAGGQAEVQFAPIRVAEGRHQGKLFLQTGDGFDWDDVRYFTVEVRPPIRMLVVAERESEAYIWRTALFPLEAANAQKPPYEIKELLQPEGLTRENLTDYQVISILNVSNLSNDAWQALYDFVLSGGGLFLALGDRTNPVSFNSQPAQTLLPGTLKQVIDVSPQGVYPTIDRTHPVLKLLRDFQGADLTSEPILKYWQVEPLPKETLVVMPLTQTGEPCVLERTFGQGARGRVMLLTSPVALQAVHGWSEWPRTFSFLLFANQTVRYLSGIVEIPLNYPAGSVVTVALNPLDPFSLYTVQDPADLVSSQTVEPRQSVLTLPAPDLVGNYRVEAQDRDRAFKKGFSVNIPTSESQFEAVSEEQLVEYLGKAPDGTARLAIARDPNDFQQIGPTGKGPVEMFSWLMLLVVVAITAEGYLANRFYRRPNARYVTT